MNRMNLFNNNNNGRYYNEDYCQNNNQNNCRCNEQNNGCCDTNYPEGSEGPRGPEGPQGAVGPAGGVLNFADFYALMPPNRRRSGIYGSRSCARCLSDCGHGDCDNNRY